MNNYTDLVFEMNFLLEIPAQSTFLYLFNPYVNL
jgi:hypothetical protein